MPSGKGTYGSKRGRPPKPNGSSKPPAPAKKKKPMKKGRKNG